MIPGEETIAVPQEGCDAAQAARGQWRPFRQQVFHDGKVEAPPYRRNGEQDEPE